MTPRLMINMKVSIRPARERMSWDRMAEECSREKMYTLIPRNTVLTSTTKSSEVASSTR